MSHLAEINIITVWNRVNFGVTRIILPYTLFFSQLCDYYIASCCFCPQLYLSLQRKKETDHYILIKPHESWLSITSKCTKSSMETFQTVDLFLICFPSMHRGEQMTHRDGSHTSCGMHACAYLFKIIKCKHPTCNLEAFLTATNRHLDSI